MENATTVEKNFSYVRDGYGRDTDVNLFAQIFIQLLKSAKISILSTTHIKKSIGVDIIEICIKKEVCDLKISIQFEENNIVSDKIEKNNSSNSRNWEEIYSNKRIPIDDWNKSEFTTILTQLNKLR